MKLKRWQKITAVVVAACLVVGGVAGVCLWKFGKKEPVVAPVAVPDSLIANADGSYGGSLDAAKYGVGAPKNGEYNVKDSAYYIAPDFYNLPSTEQRIILPQFKSYQQTMQDSSGIACLLMVLNQMGQDVKTTHTELALTERYEKVNGTTVYKNGTTAEGLAALVADLGLGYETTCGTDNLPFLPDASRNNVQILARDLFREALEAGKFVLVRYQSPTGYGWKLVIGYDTMGNVKNTQSQSESDAGGDDVLIFAEPNDGADHLQDGYATERMQDFAAWWRKMEINGVLTERHSYLIIDPHREITFDRKPVDTAAKQTLYDIHLPLNPDGTYGGTRDAGKYGSITSGRGWWNHPNQLYYKVSDFYNMGSEGSRILLKNYTVLQQTMHSSCGVCAVNSIRSYFGETEAPYDMEESYVEFYESNVPEGAIKGRGTTVDGHKLALEKLGYKVESGLSRLGEEPQFPTYESYVAFMTGHLKAGRPIAISTNFGSGHFLTVIGYDDMGTDYIYDDVFITADSCDYWDGYQDGYNVFSAYKFYTQHTNGGYYNIHAHVVLYKK